MAHELILVLDNIRSLYNVGSMFRTADGLGVSKILLCGITGTPDQHGVQKVALGAERSVPWEKVGATWAAVERLRRRGFHIYGLECGEGAADLPTFTPTYPCALVVGNEIRGITPALARRLDGIVRIPMAGAKGSFNVAVACGIALYEFRRTSPSRNGRFLLG